MALHDLDNLLLDSIPERVAYAEYELEAIMLSGSCLEKIPNNRRMVSTTSCWPATHIHDDYIFLDGSRVSLDNH